MVADLDAAKEGSRQQLVLHDWNRREPRDRDNPQRVIARAFRDHQGRLVKTTSITERDRKVGRIGQNHGGGGRLMDAALTFEVAAAGGFQRALNLRIALLLFELVEEFLAGHPQVGLVLIELVAVVSGGRDQTDSGTYPKKLADRTGERRELRPYRGLSNRNQERRLRDPPCDQHYGADFQGGFEQLDTAGGRKDTFEVAERTQSTEVEAKLRGKNEAALRGRADRRDYSNRSADHDDHDQRPVTGSGQLGARPLRTTGRQCISESQQGVATGEREQRWAQDSNAAEADRAGEIAAARDLALFAGALALLRQRRENLFVTISQVTTPSPDPSRSATRAQSPGSVPRRRVRGE